MVDAGVFINNKLYMVTGDYLEYLIIFFNSKLFNKIILQSANLTGGKGVDFMNKIRCIVPSQKQVEQSIAILKRNATDSEKDDFINSIYNLSDEQIKFLEEK